MTGEGSSRADYVYLLVFHDDDGLKTYIGQASTPARGLSHYVGSHSDKVRQIVDIAAAAGQWPHLFAVPLAVNCLEDLNALETALIDVLQTDHQTRTGNRNSTGGRTSLMVKANVDVPPEDAAAAAALALFWGAPANDQGDRANRDWNALGFATSEGIADAWQALRTSHPESLVECDIITFCHRENSELAATALKQLMPTLRSCYVVDPPGTGVGTVPAWQPFFAHLARFGVTNTSRLPGPQRLSISDLKRRLNVEHVLLVQISEKVLNQRKGLSPGLTLEELRSRAEGEWTNLITASKEAQTDRTAVVQVFRRSSSERIVLANWVIQDGSSRWTTNPGTLPLRDAEIPADGGVIGSVIETNARFAGDGTKWYR